MGIEFGPCRQADDGTHVCELASLLPFGVCVCVLEWLGLKRIYRRKVLGDGVGACEFAISTECTVHTRSNGMHGIDAEDGNVQLRKWPMAHFERAMDLIELMMIWSGT